MNPINLLRRSLSQFKRKHIIPSIVVGGFAFIAIGFVSAPVFPTTDSFVLFAENRVTLEHGVQISSGNIGSNNVITIDKASLISGDLFANTITLDKDTIINGSATFNTLTTKKGAEILGEETDRTSLPIAHLPTFSQSTPGTEDLTFSEDDNILTEGSYRNITLNKGSTLTLDGDTFSLASLTMKEGSTLVFATTTTLAIEQSFRIAQNTAILPAQNIPFDALTILYLGKQGNTKGKNTAQGVRPIRFGNNSFLNFILMAPSATVFIGERSTLRGQVFADKIWVGKGSILSREEGFSKETDLEKIVTIEGEVFPTNEIVLVMEDGATLADAQAIADSVSGTIIGFIPEIQIYKIEVPAATVEELDSFITTIETQQNPLILFIIKNLGGGLQ